MFNGVCSRLLCYKQFGFEVEGKNLALRCEQLKASLEQLDRVEREQKKAYKTGVEMLLGWGVSMEKKERYREWKVRTSLLEQVFDAESDMDMESTPRNAPEDPVEVHETVLRIPKKDLAKLKTLARRSELVFREKSQEFLLMRSPLSEELEKKAKAFQNGEGEGVEGDPFSYLTDLGSIPGLLGYLLSQKIAAGST